MSDDTDILNDREHERKNKKEREQASENISKILNPNNKYKRTQKEILKGVFEKWINKIFSEY